jgi:NAD(P)H-flavin reductase/hemoglobin-like flavoprotein
MGDEDGPRPSTGYRRRHGPAGRGVTATEAEHHGSALIHWRDHRWQSDLDTLARLHRGLLALDAGDGAARDSGPMPVLPDGGAQPVETVPRQEQPPEAARQAEAKRPPRAKRPAGAKRPAVRAPVPEQAAAPAAERAATPAAGRAAPAADPAITAIRETFRYLSDAGDKAAGFFYGQLFLRQPHLRRLFPPAMDEQRDRLLRALGRIVETQSSPEELAAYLAQLGRDHRKYGVQPEMYEAVGAALLATLRAFAKDAFTRQAEDAWTQVYTAGSSMMIRAAEQDAGASPPWWTAEVVRTEHRADRLAVLTIAPDQPLPFTAGQHLTVQTPRWPGVWRPYSIAGMPRDDGLLTLHVKAIPGGWVSNALVRHTGPGSQLVLGPPLGTMTLGRAATRDLLCVAGGTGLSPIKAIIEQAVRESGVTPRRISLYYGARRREELYDLPDLWRLADAYSGFQVIPVTSDDPAFEGMQGNVGRVAARYMPSTVCDAYVAGPPAMVRETVRVLQRAGVARERIHFDDTLLADGPRRRTAR